MPFALSARREFDNELEMQRTAISRIASVFDLKTQEFDSPLPMQ